MMAHHLVLVQGALQVLGEEEKVAELMVLLQMAQLILVAVEEEKDLVLSLLTL
jgi:hypothetical protein